MFILHFEYGYSNMENKKKKMTEYIENKGL